MMDQIIVSQFSKSFKDTVALDRVSFKVKEGEIFGFLGPSGAGKTTIINILTNQLKADSRKVAEKISTGQRQRLLLIRAILHHLKLVFLDEPISGMDPALAQKVHQLLLELKAKGTAIFLTTHNMQEASKLCDTISLLNHGEILECGSPEEIISKYHEDDTIYLRYQDGQEKVIAKADLDNYWSPEVVSMRTVEPDLETIFIQLTGEKWYDQ